MNAVTITRLKSRRQSSRRSAPACSIPRKSCCRGTLSAEINELLEQRGVLVFKQLHLTEEEQIQFTNQLGGNATEIGVDGGAIFSISLDKGEHSKAVIEYLKGSLFWHIDGTMNPVPVRGSILTSKVLPTWGGNTEFANCYAAWDDLSADARPRSTTCAWFMQCGFRSSITRPNRRSSSSRTGSRRASRNCRWCGTTNRAAIAWCWATPRAMSSARAWRKAPASSTGCANTQPASPITTRMSGKSGDSVMWDNTGTLHRAMPYDPDCGRLLKRTILLGDEAFS